MCFSLRFLKNKNKKPPHCVWGQHNLTARIDVILHVIFGQQKFQGKKGQYPGKVEAQCQSPKEQECELLHSNESTA